MIDKQTKRIDGQNTKFEQQNKAIEEQNTKIEQQNKTRPLGGK